MNFIIWMLLLVFMALGLITSAAVANARVHGWSLKVTVWIVAAHLVLAGVALVLAAKSKHTDGYQIGLSPVGWIFGSVISYRVGFVCFWFVK